MAQVHAKRSTSPARQAAGFLFGALLAALSLLAAVAAPTAAAVRSPGGLDDPSAYPMRGFGAVKGLQPDFWPEPADLTPGLATVAVNMHWASWEPVVTIPPCPPTHVEHDGRCFAVSTAVEQQVETYTAAGVAVTAVLYGTPSWARGARPCVPVAPGFETFCVPDDPDDYARFVGMVAARYDGAHGHGRITDFVIQNEVNTNQWFNVGCGAGAPCALDAWVHDYASIYNAAYDAVVASQPEARVLFSFTHHFGVDLDQPDLTHPVFSIQTFVTRLAPLVGARQWSIALHPYPNNLAARLDGRDLPFATLGNLGVVPGWLRATFPDRPRAWEVQLTEQGIHNDGSLDAEQTAALCQSFRNVLATPGITSFVYHRLRDHPDEVGLKLGLRREDGTPKPAFDLWRHVNDPGAEQCGFERHGTTEVRHGIDPTSGDHWFSSRVLPDGYLDQGEAWTLGYAEAPGTALLLECGFGASTYLSLDASCGGDTPMGPVGWIATDPAPGLAALRSCAGPSTFAPIATLAAACAPGEAEVVLGHVAGTPGPPRAAAPLVVPRFTG